MKQQLCSVAALFAALLAGGWLLNMYATAAAAEIGGVIVDIRHLATSREQGVIFSYELEVINETDATRWIILPSSARYGLPEDAAFSNWSPTRKEFSAAQPFGAIRYAGKGGATVRLSYSGYDCWVAFHVPAKGRFKGPQFSLVAPRGTDEPSALDVFVASDLLVNGKVSVAKWLPYTVTSDANVVLPPFEKQLLPTRLDWDEKRKAERTDYRQEPVYRVTGKDAVRASIEVLSKGPGEVDKRQR